MLGIARAPSRRVHRALLLSLIASCTDSPAGSPATPTRVVEAASFPAIERHALDLLLQVDNSGSTAHLQIQLAAAMPTLLAALGTTELHIGLVTSDFGSSGGPSVGTVGQGGCAGFGDDGVFRTSDAPIQGSFVIHGETKNYDGDLKDVLDRMIRVGSTGCGFEQPLAATRRALQVNDGFLRADASLAIIIIADEDDCSITDTSIFTSDTSTLGPLTSFRCTREGVVCDESLLEAGEKHNCRPNVASRYLEDPALTGRALHELEHSELVTVSAIVGLPTPFAIEARQINGESQLALAHNCSYPSPTGAWVADPPVRIASLVDSFASRGSLEPVCYGDYKPHLTRIGMAMQRSLGIACLDTSKLADTLDAPGLQPACEARDVTADNITHELPRCPAAGDCFDLVDDAICADRLRVVVDRKAAPAPDTRVEVFCERAPTP